MDNLQTLKWVVNEIAATINITAESPLHNYTIYPDQYEGGYVIYYFERMTNESGREFFNSIDEAQEWAQSTHYPSKMQPYVKPSPTKVYELAFDYKDGYFTVFMTTDKQHAIDFKESIKNHDQKFMKDYGFDDDADEVLTEQYESNHPLKPHASKIFNSLYEDSFSEWAISYAGNSFVSQLSIIEHELFVKQGE